MAGEPRGRLPRPRERRAARPWLPLRDAAEATGELRSLGAQLGLHSSSDCQGLSHDLLQILNKLRAKDGGKWQSFRAACAWLHKQSEVKSLETRLDQYRLQIILRLNELLWLAFFRVRFGVEPEILVARPGVGQVLAGSEPGVGYFVVAVHGAHGVPAGPSSVVLWARWIRPQVLVAASHHLVVAFASHRHTEPRTVVTTVFYQLPFFYLHSFDFFVWI